METRRKIRERKRRRRPYNHNCRFDLFHLVSKDMHAVCNLNVCCGHVCLPSFLFHEMAVAQLLNLIYISHCNCWISICSIHKWPSLWAICLCFSFSKFNHWTYFHTYVTVGSFKFGQKNALSNISSSKRLHHAVGDFSFVFIVIPCLWRLISEWWWPSIRFLPSAKR